LIGNWLVAWDSEELETLGHQRGKLVTVGRVVVQDILDRVPKLCKGSVGSF